MGCTTQFIMQSLARVILINYLQSNLTDTSTNCQPNNITKSQVIGNNESSVTCKPWLPKLYLPLDQNGI